MVNNFDQNTMLTLAHRLFYICCNSAQNEFIVKTLEFMLKHNCTQFLGTGYQKLRGTLIGAPWAPSYACLHLAIWEEEVVYRL